MSADTSFPAITEVLMAVPMEVTEDYWLLGYDKV
jgi:hypothetical protein